MKTCFLYLIIFIFISPVSSVFAQPGGRLSGEQREKVEAMKIAFITKRLDLSTDEAQKFWPVYNQMTKELQVIRKDRRGEKKDAREEFATMTDKEVEKVVDNEIISRQAELDILKKYNSLLKQVLPIKKLALLYKTEEDFKRHLLNEIRNQGGNKGGHGN